MYKRKLLSITVYYIMHLLFALYKIYLDCLSERASIFIIAPLTNSQLAVLPSISKKSCHYQEYWKPDNCLRKKKLFIKLKRTRISCSCAFVRVQNPYSFKNSCSIWIERSMNRTFSGIVLNMTYKTTFQCCCLKAFLSGSILRDLYEYKDIYFVRYKISAKASFMHAVSQCSYVS